MNTCLIETRETDSGPSQNLHQSSHEGTLNEHSLISLSSAVSAKVPSTSKTLDESSSSMEDIETLDDNHDGSPEAISPQENLLDCDDVEVDNGEEIYSNSLRSYSNSRSKKLWPSGNIPWPSRREFAPIGPSGVVSY